MPNFKNPFLGREGRFMSFLLDHFVCNVLSSLLSPTLHLKQKPKSREASGSSQACSLFCSDCSLLMSVGNAVGQQSLLLSQLWGSG